MKCEACGHDNVEGARFCARCGALLPADQKGPDPMIGQLIGGRFRVTGVLGEGGMGIVYVGEQQMGSTVRKVAIKTLHAHLSKDPSVLARFHRECGTVAQLEHPNTIKVYDFGATAEGTLYIAMEFVAGRPLAEVIRDEGALAPDRVIKILRQICGALDEAHQTGIIHRDLKPENVILTNRAGETDFVKLLDFGIAARSESADAQKEQKLTQQGMVLGTPPYMSPEQFTGKALDARSDIYSLGVMAYEMLTGRLPFEADTPWQWATQHMTAQPTPFETAAPSKSIPSGMRQAILRSLSKEREQRQNTARDFFAEVSDGSRMTVEAAPPAAAHVKTGTAAMEQAPDFSAAAVPMAAPRGATVPGGTPMGGMAMPAPARAPIPPAPTGGRAKSGGGKGLIVGLGALGAVLLVAMAVVAARSLKPDQEEPLAGPLGTGAPSGPVTLEPTDTAPTATPTAVANVAGAPAAPTPTPQAPPKQTGAQKPSTPSSPSTPSTPSTGASGTTTPPSTKPQPSGGGSCDLCKSLADSGNVLAAANAARSCTGDGKSACMARLRPAAGRAAQTAARNGDCATAQGIIAAASQAGVSIGAALRGTSCK